MVRPSNDSRPLLTCIASHAVEFNRDEKPSGSTGDLPSRIGTVRKKAKSAMTLRLDSSREISSRINRARSRGFSEGFRDFYRDFRESG
ncbi:Hypothetical protein NTJ_14583 [Nesidiocoris tenuis]|uniref:Uncharacterized protein n=1 Tax=Nesidiocoris tenuis TaxID=355587 RepID=A0ABN7BBK9_9HEMI|nr:Hypothetical protein NTJ_14583 [Nesidiocoris tenuis]